MAKSVVLALKATVTISMTLSLGDVYYLFAFMIIELQERTMSILGSLWAHVWSGVAVLRRPGGSLPHARAGSG